MAEFEDLLRELKDFDTKPPLSAHGEESNLGAGLRHVARTGSEIGSDILGLPGDIAQTGIWALNQPEKLGRWGLNKIGLGGLLPEEEKDFRLPIPTSQEIKGAVKGTVGKILPDKYLEATTSGEKLSDDFFGDLSTLMFPIPKIGGLGFKKALAVSGLSNLAGWGARELGAGEGAQTGAKVGTVALTALAGTPWVRNHMHSLYDVAQESITPGASVSIKSMEPLLNEIESLASKGSRTKAKQFMKDRVQEIRDKTHIRYVWNPETEIYTAKPTNMAGKESTGLTNETIYPRWGKWTKLSEKKGIETVKNIEKSGPGTAIKIKEYPHAPYTQPGREVGPAIEAKTPQEYIHMPINKEPSISQGKSYTKHRMKLLPENHIPVEEAWEFKRDMNDFLQDLDTPYRAKGNIKRLSGAFKGILKEYGKENPRFYEALSEADNIFGGLHEASKINAFLQKHINKSNLGKMTGGILLGWHSPAMAAKYATGALAARGAVQSFEALKNSSAIRNYYFKAMQSAAKQDSRGLIRNIAALDRQIKKEYPEENNKSVNNMSLQELDEMLKNI